jgi:hypothetical protein
MNGQCRMAGGTCYRNATAVLRIDGVGDRALCSDCIATLERMGVAFRRDQLGMAFRRDQLGMAFRRLDAAVPIPEWRTRLTARDMTRSPA